MKNGKSRNFLLLFKEDIFPLVFSQIILLFLTGSSLIVGGFTLYQAIDIQPPFIKITVLASGFGLIALILKVIDVHIQDFGLIALILKVIDVHIQEQINKGIEKEKEKEKIEENVKYYTNQVEIDKLTDGIQTVLNKIEQLPNVSTLFNEEIISLFNDLAALQLESQSYQSTMLWLENTNLKSIAKTSGDMALRDNTYGFFEFINILQNKKQEKESLYKNVFYGLKWIKKRFILGYPPSTPPLPKTLNEKTTISALKKIKAEILTKELQKELGEFFDELINLIQSF